MANHRSEIRCCAAFLLTCFGAVGLATQGPPQFRSRVDLTRLEVTVLDKQTRRPIHGLTSGDFIITVDGKEQRIATLAEVEVPGPAATPAAAFVEAAQDVAVNDGPTPRIFVIVMNDAGGGNDPFDAQMGKRIAHRLIDGLGPQDKAAVIFTRDNRDAQDLTTDRTLLRRAVERFRPAGTGSGLGVLRRAQDFLNGMAGYRRALVFISGIATPRPEELDPFRIDEDAQSDERDFRAVVTGSRISHVPIFLFSTHGLHAPTPRYTAGRDMDSRATAHVDAFQSIANLTGGRATVAHNAPVERVPDVLQELSSYYALGYESTYPADGRPRWLDVQVKHPNAVLMPSRLQIVPNKTASSTAPEAALLERPESGLIEALGAPLPTGDLPLRLSTLALAGTNAREHALVLTVALPSVGAGTTDVFRIRLLLFDGEGRRELRNQITDLRVQGDPGGERWHEVALRLNLQPGRYQLRVAVERQSKRTAGSVHTTVIVPDFAEEELSLSGVAVGRSARRMIAGRESILDVLSFAPTTVRVFRSDDLVGALIRVHQSTRRARDVLLETEIFDAAGAVVISTKRPLAASDFSNGKGVDHRFELPLLHLPAGDYLLRFTATAADGRATRDVRFSIAAASLGGP